MVPNDLDPSPPAALPLGDFASVFVERMRVQNFRGLQDCALELERDLTLLVGPNNSGKSRLLRALAIALGAIGPAGDDLTVAGAETSTIDVVIAPLSDPGKPDEFDARIRRRLRDVQPIGTDPVHERFAWRTTLWPSSEGWGAVSTSSILVFDAAAGQWVPQAPDRVLTSDQRGLVAADLVQTTRDLVDEMTRRGTAIDRILDDLEIPAEHREPLEASLRQVGTNVMAASSTLAALQLALRVLSASVGTIGTPRLTALPVRLEELARSVSVDFNTGQGHLPLRLHGAGARSLSSLQVQSVFYERRLGRDGPALLPHPVSLVEEPEAHLHPQAQLQLLTLLEHEHGQTIATTHSSHLASVVEPRALRLLRCLDGRTDVVDLAMFDEEEAIEKLRRLVERPFGELIFASAVVIGDGATERSLLPPLLAAALGNRAHGVSVVDAGSMSGPFAIAAVKFATQTGMPWVLFSDADAPGRLAAGQLIQDYGGGDPSHVVWGGCGAPERTGATEAMLLDFDTDMCDAACRQLGFTGPTDGLLQFMGAKKGTIGRVLATELLTRHPWKVDPADEPDCWPTPLLELVQRMDDLVPRTGALN